MIEWFESEGYILACQSAHGFRQGVVMGFELPLTDREITAWGGMGLMKRMLDHLHFDGALLRAACRNRAVIGGTPPSS